MQIFGVVLLTLKPRLLTRRTAVAVTVIALASVVAIRDCVVGGPCDRWSVGIADVFAKMIGKDLPTKWTTWEAEELSRAYRFDFEAQHLDPNKWHEIQFGDYCLVPQLQILVVTSHEGVAFMEKFEATHPGASPLLSEPRFFLLQWGGGVEGLGWQVFVSELGEFIIWTPRVTDARAITGTKLEIVYSEKLAGQNLVDVFGLAENSGIAGTSFMKGECRTLDGGVFSLVYFDGDSVARVRFINGLPADGPFAGIARFFLDLLESKGYSQRVLLDLSLKNRMWN